MRSEEDKITQAGISVVLGGETYEVRPLRIAESKEWRKGVASLLGELPKHIKANTDNPDEFASAMNSILVSMPDSIIDLFFSYAKDLPREKIEQAATDKEVAAAFGEVMKVAFPLLGELTRAIGNTA